MNKLSIFKNGILLSFLACAIFCVSCKDESFKPAPYKTTYTLIDLEKVWKLKTDTLFNNEGADYLNLPLRTYKQTDSLFTIFLPSKGRLYIFNTKSDSLSKTIDFDMEGPNGVGPLMSGDLHYFIGSDSILIFNSNKQKIFLCDGNARLLRKYDFTDYLQKNKLNAYPHLFSPIVKFKNSIYIINGITAYPKKFDRYDYKMIMGLDLDSGEITSAAPLPEVYEDGYWGATPLYMPYMDIDVDNQNLLVSYPVSPFIFNYDTKLNQTQKWEASSSKISLEPFDKVNNGYLYGKDMKFFTEANDKYREQGYYHAVLVDPYRKLYYRVNKLALGIEKIRQGKLLTPDFTISIFDENHQKVGESDVFDGEKYFHNHVFVTPKGIAIGRKDLNAEDENYLHFSLFEAQKINK